MITSVRKKHRVIPTDHGKNVLRARLSLHETQSEFAKRFMVNWMTVHKWESGKSRSCHKIHSQILKVLIQRLHEEGRLMPLDTFTTLYCENFDRKEQQANGMVLASAPDLVAVGDHSV